MKSKKKKKNSKKTSKLNVFFGGACAIVALVIGLFCVSVPLMNSASTVGNLAGVFSAIGIIYGIFAVVQMTVRKYKEASE